MYLQEVRTKTDFVLTDEQLIQLGTVACAAMREGIEAGESFGSARSRAHDAVGYGAQEMGVAVPGIPNVVFLVEAAEHQLC
jgi:hypothetical protein